jgi:hypothetical protein
MQKNVPLPLDSLKEKIFETILKPLREENLSKEYHYQLNNMTNFHQSFCALETKYAQIYAQAVSVEQRLSSWKNPGSSDINLSNNNHKLSTHHAN